MMEVGTLVGVQRRVTELPPPHVCTHSLGPTKRRVSAVWSAPCLGLAWSLAGGAFCSCGTRGNEPLSASLLCTAGLSKTGRPTLKVSIPARAILQDNLGEERHLPLLYTEWKKKKKDPSVSQKPRGQKMVNFDSFIALRTWVSPPAKWEYFGRIQGENRTVDILVRELELILWQGSVSGHCGCQDGAGL